MEIWIEVFVQREQCYGDLDQSLPPAGTMVLRCKRSRSRISVIET